MNKFIFDHSDASTDQDSSALSDLLRALRGENGGSQLSDPLLQLEQAGNLGAADNWANNWVKLSLEGFGASAAQPIADLALPSASQGSVFVFAAPAVATPSTNPKIAIAQALYPGIPVF